NVDIALGIDGYRERRVEVGVGGGPAVAAAGAAPAATGEVVDDAVGRHHANAVLGRAGDVDVALAINRDSAAAAELERGLGGPTLVAEVADHAVAGKRADGAVGCHLADALVEVVDDVQVALGVGGDAGGLVEHGLDGGLAVAVEAAGAIAGNGVDG